MVISANAPHAVGLRLGSDRSIDLRVVCRGVCEPGIGEIAIEILTFHNAHPIAELAHCLADRR